MSRRNIVLLMGITAALVLLGGTSYSLLRPVTYESTATLLLAPTPSDPDAVPSVLESFVRSGTAGTYVRLIGSRDTLRQAGSPPVAVTARAIPDSRVITVTAQGRRDVVQPAVTSIVAAASGAESKLRDVWQLEVVERATPPTRSGPPVELLLGATVLLALVAAALVPMALYHLRRLTDEKWPDDRDHAAAAQSAPARPIETQPGART